MAASGYGDMNIQRARANSTQWCNCCDQKIRELKAWPKPDDPNFRGAVCPRCDVVPPRSVPDTPPAPR